MKNLIIFLYSCSFILVANSCNKVDQVVDESAAWRKTMEEQMQVMTKTINKNIEVIHQTGDALAKSVPGERFDRIVEDLHGGDPEKKKMRQAYLKSLADIDIEESYEVSVMFEYEDSDPISAAIFQAESGNRREIEMRIRSNSLSFQPLKSEIIPYKSIEAMRTNFESRYLKTINRLFGTFSATERITPSGGGNHDYRRWLVRNSINDTQSKEAKSLSGDLRTHPTVVGFKRELESYMSNNMIKRKELATELASIALYPYEKQEYSIDNISLSSVWKALSGSKYLFILISEKDYERIKEKNFKVSALVHKSGDPNKQLYDKYLLRLNKNNFIQSFHKPVERIVPEEDPVVWYAHDMTGNSGVDFERFKKLYEAIEQIKEMDTQNN